MPTCNIDSRGKRLRLINSILLLIVSIVLAIFWAWPMGYWWAWALVGVCFAAGAFMMYEARAGWCALRAMGFKTPV